MRVVVHPQRGYYRLFFLDGGAVTAVGQVDLVRTTKGFRPKDYLMRKPGSRHGRSIPTKDLIATLRQAEVRLTRPDQEWEAFLSDLQNPLGAPVSLPYLPPGGPGHTHRCQHFGPVRKRVHLHGLCPEGGQAGVGYFTRFGKISYSYIE